MVNALERQQAMWKPGMHAVAPVRLPWHRNGMHLCISWPGVASSVCLRAVDSFKVPLATARKLQVHSRDFDAYRSCALDAAMSVFQTRFDLVAMDTGVNNTGG